MQSRLYPDLRPIHSITTTNIMAVVTVSPTVKQKGANSPSIIGSGMRSLSCHLLTVFLKVGSCGVASSFNLGTLLVGPLILSLKWLAK